MFSKAVPVTVKELEGVMNGFAVFKAKADSLIDAEIHICAADFYRLYVNGRFAAAGPARTAKGYARMDRIPLGEFNNKEGNEIVIAVSGYGCRSLSTVLQPMFLQAEVVAENNVICATGYDFECYLSNIRHAKTERYSVQRHFVEEWDLREDPFARATEISEFEAPPKVIERVAAYPHYEYIPVSSAAVIGDFSNDPEITLSSEYYSFIPSERWGRYPSEEIERHSYKWVRKQKQFSTEKNVALPLNIKKGNYALFDLSRIEVGFLKLLGSAEDRTDLVVAFSEYSSPDVFRFVDYMNAHNVIDLTLGGKFDFLSFEPYTFKYVAVFVKEGALHLDAFGVETYSYDLSGINIPDEIQDPCLRKIYSGAMRSFAHNAVDLYTDCPSRERAGWLCDSYFTAKTEYCLRKNTVIEDAFLENYVLYENEGEFPEGALPMCYPADDQDDKTFIPQWTMWYIIEVEDYINNRGHKADTEKFRKSIYALLDFYSHYENADGLLEKLPSWNFVEWSRANEWTQDVNYPTNFLYAETLRCVDRIFGDKKAAEKAKKVASETVRQSFNGEIFLDHAVRENGALVRRDDCSEACQYYAILFGDVDTALPKYAKLRNLVLNVFGADRAVLLEEIAPINAFIGAYLRLEALLKMRENDTVIKSIKTFFGGMADETETLWEYRKPHGSQDHGFASYALVAMRLALGIDKN